MTEGRNPGGFVPVDAIFAGSGATCVQHSAGEKLREARGRLGLTLDSAAARTRIRRDAAIVEQFKHEVDTQTGRAVPTAPKEKREIKLPRGAFGAVLILAGVAGVAWWYANTASGEGAFADVPPPPDAELSILEDGLLTPGTDWSVNEVWRNLPPPGSTVEEVVLVASEATWVEVRDGSGRLLFSRELGAGQQFRGMSEPGLTVTTTDAGLIEVFIDGTSYGLLGEPGIGVDEFPVDAEAFAVAELDPELAG